MTLYGIFQISFLYCIFSKSSSFSMKTFLLIFMHCLSNISWSISSLLGFLRPNYLMVKLWFLIVGSMISNCELPPTIFYLVFPLWMFLLSCLVFVELPAKDLSVVRSCLAFSPLNFRVFCLSASPSEDKSWPLLESWLSSFGL